MFHFSQSTQKKQTYFFYLQLIQGKKEKTNKKQPCLLCYQGTRVLSPEDFPMAESIVIVTMH